MDAKAVIKALKAEGWVELRKRGSHVQMGKDDLRTTIPSHGKKDIKIGTLKKIEKDTGVKFN